jgi:hypothetical protein
MNRNISLPERQFAKRLLNNGLQKKVRVQRTTLCTDTRNKAEAGGGENTEMDSEGTGGTLCARGFWLGFWSRNTERTGLAATSSSTLLSVSPGECWDSTCNRPQPSKSLTSQDSDCGLTSFHAVH